MGLCCPGFILCACLRRSGYVSLTGKHLCLKFTSRSTCICMQPTVYRVTPCNCLSHESTLPHWRISSHIVQNIFNYGHIYRPTSTKNMCRCRTATSLAPCTTFYHKSPSNACTTKCKSLTCCPPTSTNMPMYNHSILGCSIVITRWVCECRCYCEEESSVKY